jgi:Bacterial Ig-like domain (group 2)/Galactose oxidase, central domain/Kelch motif
VRLTWSPGLNSISNTKATSFDNSIRTLTGGLVFSFTRQNDFFLRFLPSIAVTLVFGFFLSGCAGNPNTASSACGFNGFDSPSCPELASLTISPAFPQIPTSGGKQFKVTGANTDGTTEDLTGSVTWTSSVPGVATISATGTATSLTDGETIIQASSTMPIIAGTATDFTVLTVWESAAFVSTGNLVSARDEQTATLLGSGNVLIAGGFSFSPTMLAEVYDPPSGTFSSTGNMTVPREAHTATLLNDGKVLIVGGGDNSGVLASAELYDPAGGTFTLTGSMITARSGHSATLLGNGKVLIAGGVGGGVSPNPMSLASAELYDPVSGTFTATGSMISERSAHTATLLNSGKVLITGGVAFNQGTPTPLSTAELYDPVSGTFSPTAAMSVPRTAHTATLLNDGTVLVIGGTTNAVNSVLATAELYDPLAATFSAVGNMIISRYNHTATLLNSGSVLVTGGVGSPGAIFPATKTLGNAELYDPPSRTFGPTGAMTTAREVHTATLLNNGTVLLVGGYGVSTVEPLGTAELYQGP